MRVRLALSVALGWGLAVLAATPSAAVGGPWLTQAEVRTMLVGHAMRGYYRSKNPSEDNSLDYYRKAPRWVDDYAVDGGIKYKYLQDDWSGRWSFQDDVFCTFYEGNQGGCYLMRQVNANCYEYVIVPDNHSGSDLPPGLSSEWFARGWRGAEASTCEELMTS